MELSSFFCAMGIWFLGAARLCLSFPTWARWARQRANKLVQHIGEIIRILWANATFGVDSVCRSAIVQRGNRRNNSFSILRSREIFTLGVAQVQFQRVMNEPVVAPITGIVWKVLVSEGDEVVLGQSLILLESMKMEVPVYSPAAGAVAAIHVAAGDSVEDGEELATIHVDHGRGEQDIFGNG